MIKNFFDYKKNVEPYRLKTVAKQNLTENAKL